MSSRLARNIRQPADVLVSRRAHDRRVRMALVLQDCDPPTGRIIPESAQGRSTETELAGAREVPFTGWLGLLKALSDVIDAQKSGQVPSA